MLVGISMNLMFALHRSTSLLSVGRFWAVPFVCVKTRFYDALPAICADASNKKHKHETEKVDLEVVACRCRMYINSVCCATHTCIFKLYIFM